MVLDVEKEMYGPLSGETDALLETLFAGERTQLIRLCAYLTGSPDAAEDLAQETLLEAWRNRQKLHYQDDGQGKENWIKWLRAIARYVCMRWARSRGRDLAHLAPLHAFDDETGSDAENLPAAECDVEIELERDELAQLLDRALALLPPATRAVLIERYIYESPHAEIAGRLGLSEDALVQRLYRGKLALRRVITTQMSEEAAAYGFSALVEEQLKQETRIWCPMCSNDRLIKYADPSTERTGFTCPSCWHIASALHPHIWHGVNSPRSILRRQLAWLGDYYWQAIEQGQVLCSTCGQPARATICHLQEYDRRGGGSPHGVSIICSHCHAEEINPLSHLALDTLQARQFWCEHPRMLWVPEREIEYGGQAALLSSFQSTTDSARIDVVFQRETLRVLGTHQNTSKQ
jgi:RNA polymerase sigma factor (sigma-70 family)